MKGHDIGNSGCPAFRLMVGNRHRLRRGRQTESAGSRDTDPTAGDVRRRAWALFTSAVCAEPGGDVVEAVNDDVFVDVLMAGDNDISTPAAVIPSCLSLIHI